MYKYIIKSPYTDALIAPRKVEVVSEHAQACDGYLRLQEYPPIPGNLSLDEYGVMVPADEAYDTEVEALRALTTTLLYKIKTFQQQFNSIIL